MSLTNKAIFDMVKQSFDHNGIVDGLSIQTISYQDHLTLELNINSLVGRVLTQIEYKFEDTFEEENMHRTILKDIKWEVENLETTDQAAIKRILDDINKGLA